MERETKQAKSIKPFSLSIIGKELFDGTLLEAVYDPRREKAELISFEDKEIKTWSTYTDPNSGNVYRPAEDCHLKYDTVLLPTEVGETGEISTLLADVQKFVHNYVDLSPAFEAIVARYVLMTWVYNCFPKIPYLQVIGDYATGKTTFLNVMRAICYHSIFLGSSTTASIYRMTNEYGGTCFFDETNFIPGSENFNSFTKVMNVGFDREGVVTLTERTIHGFKAVTYNPFGPKIIASHQEYHDKALRSRIITNFTYQKTRDDIQGFPEHRHWTEAVSLRNRLLSYRLHHFQEVKARISEPILGLDEYESRVREVYQPLFVAAQEPSVPEHIKAYIDKEISRQKYNLQYTDEGIVLKAVKEEIMQGKGFTSPGEISERVKETGWNISPRKAGDLLRKLGIDDYARTSSKIQYRLDPERLKAQFLRYGIE